MVCMKLLVNCRYGLSKTVLLIYSKCRMGQLTQIMFIIMSSVQQSMDGTEKISTSLGMRKNSNKYLCLG